MAACLCKLFGCLKPEKPVQLPDGSTTTPGTSQSKQDKDHTEKDLSGINIEKVSVGIPKNVQSETSNHVPSEAVLLKSQEKIPTLSLAFQYKAQLVFTQRMRGNSVQESRVISVKWPPKQSTKDICMEFFGIKNNSEQLLGNKGKVEFIWQPHENMVHYSQGSYFWNDEAVSRLIFRKIGGVAADEPPLDKVIQDVVLGCSGNLLGFKIGIHYMTVEFASSEGVKTASFGNNEEIKVGRMIDCNVKLSGANCSRYQCTLRRIHGEWILEVGHQGKLPEKGIWKLVASSTEPIDPNGIYMIGGLIVRPLLASPT